MQDPIDSAFRALFFVAAFGRQRHRAANRRDHEATKTIASCAAHNSAQYQDLDVFCGRRTVGRR
jgi:hypothetical protein